MTSDSESTADDPPQKLASILDGLEDAEIISWTTDIFELYDDTYTDDVRIDQKWGNEGTHIPKYLKKIKETISTNYELIEPYAIGGTAVVFKIVHRRTNQDLIVKFNRPLSDFSDDLQMVKTESEVLPELEHNHVIRAIDRGEISIDSAPDLYYVVEPLRSGYVDLEEYIEDISSDLKEKRKEGGSIEEEIENLLYDLTSLFRQWVSALKYLHDHNYIHLDVKPENVLIDIDNNHLEMIDLGSVQKHLKDDTTPVDVFFTQRYAHPFVRQSSVDDASSNRFRGRLNKNELKYEFDYFALGSSILEILDSVADASPHSCPQLPIFKSLHFLGTRLLDGKNEDSEEEGPFVQYSYARRTYEDLYPEDYKSLRYQSLPDVKRDLMKEEGLWTPEEEVPELAAYSEDVLRVNPDMNIVLTDRLTELIEHPMLARLKMINQLGLIRQVYPSADHSRYDHTLGTYFHTVEYIKALFYDDNNPIFRNLIDKEDIERTLLSSLIHDVGHYPLAHDLGEIDEDIFGHLQMSIRFLDDTTVKDGQGRTLSQIIESQWDVDVENIAEILEVDPRVERVRRSPDIMDFKTDLLSAILDGPIDADKADYIGRDSKMCGLTYGDQLDIDRLLRVITVARLKHSSANKPRVTIGVYEKGMTSAQSFTQARYQLYSSVFWHHTSRIIKSMLQYATSLWINNAFGSVDNLETDTKDQINRRLSRFTKDLNSTNPLGDILQREREHVDLKGTDPLTKEAKKDVIQEWEQKIEEQLSSDLEFPAEQGNWHPGTSWTDYLMLTWIRNQPQIGAQSKKLIDLIASRELYKRIHKIPISGNENLTQLARDLGWDEKIKLCENIQEEIRHKLDDRGVFDKDSELNTMTLFGKSEDELEGILNNHLAILLDVPDPNDIGYDERRPLVKVPELETKTYYQDTQGAQPDASWAETVKDMMKQCASLRLVCHPDLRKPISSQIDHDTIHDIVEAHIRSIS